MLYTVLLLSLFMILAVSHFKVFFLIIIISICIDLLSVQSISSTLSGCNSVSAPILLLRLRGVTCLKPPSEIMARVKTETF